MLAGCPRLEKLELDIFVRAADFTSTETFSPVDLPQLRQLTLVGAYPVPTATVLDHLRCPRLEVATIGFHYHFFGSQEISPMTYHLLGAIKPKLQTLLQGVTRFKLTLATCGVWFCMVRPEQLVSIKFSGFDWRPVLEWALEEFPEIVELCVSALIFPPTASRGNMPTSRFSAVQDLVTPLRNLEVVGVSGNPEISQILDTFIQEDSQVESSLHIPPNLLGILLNGCLCPWKDDVKRKLEGRHSYQRGGVTCPQIVIVANEDCKECAATRDALRPFVDDISFLMISN